MTISERDLKRHHDRTKDVVFYQATFPDGRFVQITKIGVNKFTQTGRGLHVRCVPGWAWDVIDPVTKQVASAEPFKTRKLALENCIEWSAKHAAGVRRPEIEDTVSPEEFDRRCNDAAHLPQA